MLARMDKSRVVLSSRDAIVSKKKEEPERREPSPPPKVCSPLCLCLLETLVVLIIYCWIDETVTECVCACVCDNIYFCVGHLACRLVFIVNFFETGIAKYMMLTIICHCVKLIMCAIWPRKEMIDRTIKVWDHAFTPRLPSPPHSPTHPLSSFSYPATSTKQERKKRT